MASIPDPPKPKGASAASEPIAQQAANRRFFVCLGLLIAAAAVLPLSAQFLNKHFRKLALPTKKPLPFLDAGRLLPQFQLATQPHRFGPDEEANLGTKDYLMVQLLDRRQLPTDPTARAHVFLSYYTGKPDMVPHNPEECNQAAGFALVNKTLIEVEMPGPGGKSVKIPVAVLEFDPPDVRKAMLSGGAAVRRTVMFFFYTNGGYATTRSEVRWRVSNLADRYAYYSKIEVSFMDGAGRPATREQSVEALPPLLKTLMPVLWQDHYQDWDAVSRGQPPVVSPS
jgi:hypothetical protein